VAPGGEDEPELACLQPRKAADSGLLADPALRINAEIALSGPNSHRSEACPAIAKSPYIVEMALALSVRGPRTFQS